MLHNWRHSRILPLLGEPENRLRILVSIHILGIHSMDRAEKEAAEAAASAQPTEQSEGELSAEELGPTPPDSPIPSTGAFAPIPPGGPDLDDEFFAIPSNPCKSLFLVC